MEHLCFGVNILNHLEIVHSLEHRIYAECTGNTLLRASHYEKKCARFQNSFPLEVRTRLQVIKLSSIVGELSLQIFFVVSCNRNSLKKHEKYSNKSYVELYWHDSNERFKRVLERRTRYCDVCFYSLVIRTSYN